MTCATLFSFLTEHPDFSPVLRLMGDPRRVETWRVEVAGVTTGKGGRLCALRDVEMALFGKE